jgi:hypothetical protein
MIYISVSTTNYTTYTSHHDLLTSGQVAVLRVTLNLDGTPITSKSHTHLTYSQSSRLLTSSLSLGVPVPRVTQCIRDV